MLSLSLNTPPQAQVEALRDLGFGLFVHSTLLSFLAVAALALLLLPSGPLGPQLIQHV
jgi:hypothetical protein